MEIPIELTLNAKKEVHRLILKEKVRPPQGLRIGVKLGGCQGFSYVLGFDVPTERDLKFQVDNIPVYIDKAHLIYLKGMCIDFHNGLNSRGFIFENPNAKDVCGCGTSFRTE